MSEFDFGPGLRIEERIDAHEADAITERWEFGRWMLTFVPKGAKKLPDGFLEQLSRTTGKSGRELRYRRQFAEAHPTKAAIRQCIAESRSWFEITQSVLSDSNGAHVANNSGENEWYTPEEYIDAARAVMGGIDLDPASTTTANEVVRADKFFSIADNGLAQRWEGKVWMNPPYGRPLIDQFCDKLADAYASGDVTKACVLVNNATETSWFQCLSDVMTAVFFPAKRITYWAPGRESKTGLQGQAVLYFGTSGNRFRQEFGSRISGWSAAL